jgi:hypothetical protein
MCELPNWEVLPNPSHMGSDVVVATVGTLASHNILQHPLASLIGIYHKHQVVAGFIRLVSGLNCGLPGPMRLASVQRITEFDDETSYSLAMQSLASSRLPSDGILA